MTGQMRVHTRAVERARTAKTWGMVLGTLGRQGNPAILTHLQAKFTDKGLSYQVILLSELTPDKIRMLEGIDAWVQIACPRLSIDWGEGFHKPVLTPYEAEVRSLLL
jgi:2-(3-amino-3-carboxypropyl)histidine synthase